MKVISGAAALILALAASSALAATVYRHVDENGNVTFSDEPIKGGDTVDIKPVTTVTLPKPQVVERTDKLREEVQREGAVYDRVAITSPEDGQAFQSGSGDVRFEVSSTPGLQKGHKYEVTIDGQPVGQSTSGSIVANNVYRGTHQANVSIVDANGVQVKTGTPISFTVHRPSVLN